MFALLVRFTLRPGAAEAFDALVADTLDAIVEHEPGTLVYAAHRVDGHPDQRIFYECYADRAAFDAHETQPHTRRFLEARDAHLEAAEVDFLTLQKAKGVT